MKYGQQAYDFDKGTMIFIAPKQIQSVSKSEIFDVKNDCGDGYTLLFHPDFLYGHLLSAEIKQYSFFSYSVNEALHLSKQEEDSIIDIFYKIKKEYQHIDKHTQDIILSQIDLLLNYSNRFYERQFITRKAVNSDLLIRFEQEIENYFNHKETQQNGLPSVEYFANKLHLSSHYLSDMLRSVSGQSAKHHIQDKLIEKAKERLSTTQLSISEIAYELGFEYPQSFSKLFKQKTNQSPLEFRQSFN